jgi:hypothetical protein
MMNLKESYHDKHWNGRIKDGPNMVTKKKIPVLVENWASVVQTAATSDIYLASAHDT